MLLVRNTSNNGRMLRSGAVSQHVTACPAVHDSQAGARDRGRQEALVSKEAFNAEMGDLLFSLTADGAVAARARELAGVPLMAAELRRKWCVPLADGRVPGLGKGAGSNGPSS